MPDRDLGSNDPLASSLGDDERQYDGEINKSSDDEGEDIVEEIAGIVDKFLKELEIHLRSLTSSEAQGQPSSSPSSHSTEVPETEEEYRTYVWDFIDDNLRYFYRPDDPRVKELIQNAAARAKELQEEYQLSQNTTPSLIKMALYDFVILCGKARLGRKRNTLKADLN